MDNKTLALLGLGAALTAFLSHQSYKSGEPWFGGGSSVPEGTALSDDSGDSDPVTETVSEIPPANSPKTQHSDPKTCHPYLDVSEDLKDNQFLHDKNRHINIREIIQKKGNERFKFEPSEENIKELYERLDRFYPECARGRSPEYCLKTDNKVSGTCAERQRAIDNLYVVAKLSFYDTIWQKEDVEDDFYKKVGRDAYYDEKERVHGRHWLKLRCIDLFTVQDTRNDRVPIAFKKCTSNKDCSIGLYPMPIAVNREFIGDLAGRVHYDEGTSHRCNECGVCNKQLTGRYDEKITFLVEDVTLEQSASDGSAPTSPVYLCKKLEARCKATGLPYRECKIEITNTNIQAETAAECEEKYIEANGLAAAAAKIAAARSEAAASSPAPVPPASGGGVSAAE